MSSKDDRQKQKARARSQTAAHRRRRPERDAGAPKAKARAASTAKAKAPSLKAAARLKAAETATRAAATPPVAVEAPAGGGPAASISAFLREPWRYPRINREFTIACFASPPILGSVVSFVFHGGALWCMFEVLTGRRPFPGDRHVRLLTAVAWTLVAVYLASALINGSVGRDPVSIAWLFTFFVFPFSYAIWSISDKATIMRAAIAASAFACAGAAVLAVVQTGFLGMRPEGAAGNAIVFATVTVLFSSLALIGALREKGLISYLYLGAYLAGLVAVVLSGTRGIWPAAFMNLFVIVAIYRREVRWTSPVVMILLAGAVLAFAAVFAWFMLPRLETAVGDIQELAIDNYDSSLGMRLALWGEGARLWQERPILGFGPDSIPGLVETRIAPLFDMPIVVTHFHNDFLTALIEAGLLGMASHLALLAVPVWLAIGVLRGRPGPVETAGALILISLVATYFTAGLTSIMIGHDILDTVFVMTLVVGSYLACGKSAVRAEAAPVSA